MPRKMKPKPRLPHRPKSAARPEPEAAVEPEVEPASVEAEIEEEEIDLAAEPEEEMPPPGEAFTHRFDGLLITSEPRSHRRRGKVHALGTGHLKHALFLGL